MANQRLDNLSDEALVLGAILGDVRSFDTLVMRYRGAAYRVAQSIAGAELADDVVQESLLLAFKALPSIEEPEKFASWLYAVVRHEALRWSQRARRESQRRVDLDDAIIANSPALARPFVPVESFETAWVRAAIEDLEADYRLILKLRFYDEMPLKRIAGFLGLPLTTVKWRLHRAKELLRQHLSNETKQSRKRARVQV